MSNKETLVILTPGFPESEADSTCLPMQQQFVKALREQYEEVEVVVLTFQYPYHQQEYNWNDIRVIPFGGKNKGGLQKLLLRNKISSTLRKLYQGNKIIGLFSFWYNECAFIGRKFGDKHGIKHYCWILGQDARQGNEYPKLLPPRANELIALSDFIQNEFERNHGIRPQFVVLPGIDETLFVNTSREKDIDLLGVGSLIPLKRYDIFLDVIAQIKKQIPGIRAVLVGQGPEEGKLQSLISKFELENNVRMTRELPYGEVLALMKRAKVLLHPSSYEGFGCVCLEALYAGAHVISFCRPIDVQITHWHIVENKNAAIAKASEVLLDQHTEYKPVRGFSINKTATCVMSLFREN